tara:strand:- start:1543 stop:2832 length:1290 start_codon:yes stop_codon:yes gene_type:complete
MKEINISVIGLGTVGSSVISSIENINKNLKNKNNTLINIIGISAKNKNKSRSIDISKYKWVDDPIELTKNNNCHVIIELIGQEKGLSYEIIKSSLQNKINVITANKALLANFGNELFQIAEKNDVNIFYEAAVAGGIPIINILKNSLFFNKIKNISGILNGTTNYILSSMEKNNLSFQNALDLASEKGYAESDPTNDIEGIDSAHKITLLSSLCYGIKINHKYSKYQGIKNFNSADIRYSRKLGYKIKLISESSLINNKIFINTAPKLISLKNPLAHVDGVLNAINIETDHLKSLFFEGEGAGGLATSSSVIADLFEIIKTSTLKNPGYNASILREVSAYDADNLKNSFYMRIIVKDQPGVLSKITSILTAKNISIQTILQLNEEKINNRIPIILTTYDTFERDLISAKQDIGKESFVEDDIITITIQN